MKALFPVDYKSIVDKIDAVDPLKYGKTRNYVDGAVTYLSPYISRGAISTRQVLQHVLSKGYKLEQIESFVKELCWRDYFQRVAQEKDIMQDIRQAQSHVLNTEIPTAIVNANTGINGIDNAIKTLYETGYMHNHCRMYTASIVCNIAQSHWLLPAKWMYYHLLDGDFASNTCSWQWVAGTNSSKKYYANQENINRHTHTNQSNTYIDYTYEVIEVINVPEELKTIQNLTLTTHLPDNTGFDCDSNLPTFIYNYYNLDPLWHKDENGNRILLLEPELFLSYPISEKCMEFILELSQNISNLKIYVGSIGSLIEKYNLKEVFFKEHPFNKGYTGTEEPRDWIVDSISGYYPSFFSYWKKIEPIIRKKYF